MAITGGAGANSSRVFAGSALLITVLVLAIVGRKFAYPAVLLKPIGAKANTGRLFTRNNLVY
jgi:hypothetical protein